MSSGGIPISDLPSATLPLSGVEEIPLVQGGVTKQAPASSIGSLFGGVSSFSAGTTGLTPSSPTTGAVVLAGTLAVANGGTGVTSSTGTGSVVLSNGPTLIAPNIGAASGTTLGLTGQVTINLNSASPPAATSPGVQVTGANGQSGVLETVSFATNSIVVGRRANGTGASPTAVSNGDALMAFAAQGYDGASWAAGGSIQLAAAENWSGTAHGTLYNLRVIPPGPTTGVIVASITSTGLNACAIGATTPSTGAFTTLTATGNVAIGGIVNTGTYIVSTLPGALIAYRGLVTDATVTTFASIVAGTGSNKVPVYYDGTNWRIG